MYKECDCIACMGARAYDNLQTAERQEHLNRLYGERRGLMAEPDRLQPPTDRLLVEILNELRDIRGALTTQQPADDFEAGALEAAEGPPRFGEVLRYQCRCAECQGSY